LDLSASLAAGDEPEAGTLYSTIQEVGNVPAIWVATRNLPSHVVIWGGRLFYFQYRKVWPKNHRNSNGEPIKQTGGMNMIDIKLIRTEPELVKENIRKKFQDQKLVLVDEVIDLDRRYREAKTRCDEIRSQRNSISKETGHLMAKGMREEAEKNKAKVVEITEELAELQKLEEKLEADIRERMLVIPNIIDSSVPIGKDDSENVEVERYGEPKVPDFEIPYHVDIMERLRGIDLDSARKTSGNGFYYLCGDIARLHSAILAYARDFMIDRGFTYYIPPFMIRSEVVTGVMSLLKWRT
jgi:seryl-tRNA synthetase